MQRNVRALRQIKAGKDFGAFLPVKKAREAGIKPELIEPGDPPSGAPHILVTIIEDSRMVVVSALVEAADGALVALGPYVFETPLPNENEALGMQAATSLRAQYKAKIYLQCRPYLYLN